MARPASYVDKTWQGFVEGARNFAFGPAAALEPFANVAYVHVGGDVSEAGLAAMSGSTSFDTTYTTLGAHGSYVLPAGLTAQATLGWRYAFATSRRLSSLAFQPGGAAFALAGSPIARNALVTELGVNYAIGPSATIGIAYSGQYAAGPTRTPARRRSPCGFSNCAGREDAGRWPRRRHHSALIATMNSRGYANRVRPSGWVG